MNAAKPSDKSEIRIHFAQQSFVPLLSGGLFWPSEQTLIVADLHFEKLSSFARSGQLLPPYDTGQTLKALECDLELTGAICVIALGDSFHRDEGTLSLLPDDRAFLERLTARAHWTWLGGNHDPSPHDLGGVCRKDLLCNEILMTHEPETGSRWAMAGHLHPAACVRINGRAARRPCFVHDQHLMILPAYGAATGSMNILSPPFAGLFDWSKLNVTMIGREQLYPVSPKRLTIR